VPPLNVSNVQSITHKCGRQNARRQNGFIASFSRNASYVETRVNTKREVNVSIKMQSSDEDQPETFI
jgi:hypothetical protein